MYHIISTFSSIYSEIDDLLINVLVIKVGSEVLCSPVSGR